MTPIEKQMREGEKYFFESFVRNFTGAFLKFVTAYIKQLEEKRTKVIKELGKDVSDDKVLENIKNELEEDLEKVEDEMDKELEKEIQDEEESEDDIPSISSQDREEIDPRELIENLLKKVLKDTNLKVEAVGKKKKKIVIEL